MSSFLPDHVGGVVWRDGVAGEGRNSHQRRFEQYRAERLWLYGLAEAMKAVTPLDLTDWITGFVDGGNTPLTAAR